MIKNIILDMGNVLLIYDPEIPLNQFCRSEEAKDIIRKELFQGPEWIQGDYGYITNKERFDSVKKRIPEKFHEELKKCVDGWNTFMNPVPGAADFCDFIKNRGMKIFVLSNACNTFHDYFPRFKEEAFFDGVMVSSDVHMIKPERRIYELFLDTYRLIPEECLFIDDREENVAGAEETDINGFVFKGDFTPVINSLINQERQG